MASITIRDVKKSYAKTQVVHGVDLDIASGEFVVILGPSGCGKSTLLRMIAGLEDISGGKIAIDGTVVNKLEPRERGCAMVFQNYALYPHMSVAQNIGYSLKVAGVPAAERTQRIQAVARTLELEHLLDRKPMALSGGQRQRVAMGRAMIREPKVFLFDEPLSNLDAKLRVQMRSEIRKLHRRLNATSVFVTHDQVEAMTLADRLVVMNGGRVEQVGTPGEIYNRPASRFVATFVGAPAMNILEGTVELDGLSLLGGSRRLAVRTRRPAGRHEGRGGHPAGSRSAGGARHGRRARCHRRPGRGTGRGAGHLCRSRRRAVFGDDVGGRPPRARQRGRPEDFARGHAFLLVGDGKPSRCLQGFRSRAGTLISEASHHRR